MNIIDTLNWRYATKAFDTSKKIENEDLNTLIEAFRLTPSSFGLQPWKLFVVKSQMLKDSLVEHSWNQPQISDCSELFVLARPTSFTESDVDEFVKDIADTRDQSIEDIQWYSDMMKWFLSNMDDDAKKVWIEKQIYIALGNLMTVCAQMEIDSCPVEWFVSAKYDELLWLTDKWYASVVVLPVGYRDNSDKYAAAKKVRYSTDRVVEIM